LELGWFEKMSIKSRCLSFLFGNWVQLPLGA
jgi:hypothetical protein